MTDFTNTFNAGKVQRSSSVVEGGCCTEDKDEVPKMIPLPPGLTKIVTNVATACHEETGKPWIVQTCQVFDEACGAWKEVMEGVVEQDTSYKASTEENPVTLPDFNGVIDAFDTDGNPIELIGGQETPENMAGTLFCIGGELCYVAAPPPVEEVVIPDEVDISGSLPELDSGVKLAIAPDGTIKYAGRDGWTQVKPYGDKS
jgi:hypothetical protein